MRCTALTLMRRPVMAKGGRDEWLETTGMLADKHAWNGIHRWMPGARKRQTWQCSLRWCMRAAAVVQARAGERWGGVLCVAQRASHSPSMRLLRAV